MARKKNDIEMYSALNEGKSVVAERFIRTFKNEIYKYMASILKNVYIDKLDDSVNKWKLEEVVWWFKKLKTLYHGERVKTELDLSNYARKADLKNAKCVNISDKIKNIEDKIPNITNLPTNTTLNAKINEVKNLCISV